jgi:anti-sigma28 factor (negative regulator of flagellin synthesis)
MSTTTNQNAGSALNHAETKKEAIRLRRRPRRFKPAQLADVSSAMKLAGRASELPEIRWDLVNRVKAEIAAGTYETPERIEATAEILLTELLGPE